MVTMEKPSINYAVIGVCMVWVRVCGGGCDSLSHVAFGGGMKGDQLHDVRVLWPHLIEHLLEGVELAVLCVHIVLVHLKARQVHP